MQELPLDPSCRKCRGESLPLDRVDLYLFFFGFLLHLGLQLSFGLMRNTLLKANSTARYQIPWPCGGVGVNGGMPDPDLETAFSLRY